MPGCAWPYAAAPPSPAAKDLAGQRVAVEWGSLGDMVGRRLQREGIALELVPFETPAEAVQALANDTTIAAALVDQVTLRQLQGQGLPVVAVGPPLESSPYVVVTPVRARDLQQQLAEALEALRRDGALAELEDEVVWRVRRLAVGHLPGSLELPGRSGPSARLLCCLPLSSILLPGRSYGFNCGGSRNVCPQ